MPSVPPPPPPAPERTQPQQGGQPRSTLHDPVMLAANFCSSGWRKDLEHILRVYYRFSIASFTEAEWASVKERFFDHFIQHKGEALALKEARPMDFMAYIQDLFYQATGLHLDGLASFTGWIKQGSYYHEIVAWQGCLHECLHLMGAPLPRWPQVSPSKSRRESQMKSDTQAHSSSRSSVGAKVAPVAETPVAEVPVAVAPITEAPVGEAQDAEALVAPSPPAPMETGGVGDGQSWAEQVELVKKNHFRGAGQLNTPALNPRGVSQNPGFPSPSRTVRGGSPLSRSCVSMQLCNQPPHTMWQVGQLCTYTLTCCHKRPRALETKCPA